MLKLGLVCISNALKKQGVSFKTMTRKSYLAGVESESRTKLYSIWSHNVHVMGKIISFCAENNIQHYRVSSNLFPLATDPITNVKFSDVDLTARRLLLRQVGDLAREKGISISAHPDQFNILASENENIVKNTIRELNFQASVLDDMGFPDAPMCLHVGLSPKGDVSEYVDKFKLNFRRTDLSVQRKLCLENEDKGFWDALNLFHWFSKDFPLIYDSWHHRMNPCDLSPSEAITRFKGTWKNRIPIFHWSEGITNNSRSHADYFTCVPDEILKNADCLYECEVKAKDFAIFKARQDFNL